MDTGLFRTRVLVELVVFGLLFLPAVTAQNTSPSAAGQKVSSDDPMSVGEPDVARIAHNDTDTWLPSDSSASSSTVGHEASQGETSGSSHIVNGVPTGPHAVQDQNTSDENANSTLVIRTPVLTPPFPQSGNVSDVEAVWVVEEIFIPEVPQHGEAVPMDSYPFTGQPNPVSVQEGPPHPAVVVEPAPPTPPPRPSLFDRVDSLFPDFESQVVALHTELCGSFCWFSHDRAQPKVSIACALCYCDRLCHVYGDCCPDLQLLTHSQSGTSDSPPQWKEMEHLTQDRDLYTCEVSHLKPSPRELDYDNYFAMVNYCPQTDLQNTTAPSVQANLSQQANREQFLDLSLQEHQSLESQCENRENSSHWHYVRPMYSPQDGVVYRNKFCAQCHGQPLHNLTAWATRIDCDADLLYTATSAKEAYFLAVDTPGCDVRFSRTQAEDPRRCRSVQRPVISSCNVTGLWVHYDPRVERACASFTSPVKKRYKNVFCYLCNDDLWFEEAQHYLDQGVDAANVGRVSFYALLALDDDDDNEVTIDSDVMSAQASERGDGNRDDCETATIFDPIHCECRPVKCGEGLRVEGDKCIDVFASSNYFGFRVCSRFHVTAVLPVAETPAYHILAFNMGHLPGDATVKQAAAYPLVDCEDDTKMTVDVQQAIYSVSAFRLQELADLVLQGITGIMQIMSSLEGFNITSTVPAAGCIDSLQWAESIHDDCPTRNSSEALGVHISIGPTRTGVKDQMAFSTLYNTTFCPHVNLSAAQFSNLSETIQPLNIAELTVRLDVTVVGNETFYLLCAEDFLKLLNGSDSCSTKPSSSDFAVPVSGFQDTWTVVGLTSVVCTCVSLASLMCVIVTYSVLPALRAGTGQSTLAMACLLFVAQALHELGIEQYEELWLCLLLALLIHFFWLSAVFMMTCCTLQLFVSMRFPIKARMMLASRKVLAVSLACSLGLSAVIVGLTMSFNQLLHSDLGYPARYLCFIRRRLSRQLGFGLPLGLAVVLNILLFVVTMTYIRRRPRVSSTKQDHVSLVACFRLSVMTGACWLTLFLLELPGTRPWLEYVFVVLLALQGLMLASTLLLNARVYNLWKSVFNANSKTDKGSRGTGTHSSGNTASTVTHSGKHKSAVTSFNSNEVQDRHLHKSDSFPHSSPDTEEIRNSASLKPETTKF